MSSVTYPTAEVAGHIYTACVAMNTTRGLPHFVLDFLLIKDDSNQSELIFLFLRSVFESTCLNVVKNILVKDEREHGQTWP